MANIRHVSMLQKDVKEWNDWRESNPDIRPDLDEADLEDACLSGANLSGANLNGANLDSADLQQAVINNAQMIGASFEEADLCESTMNYTDASSTIFINADLTKANLKGSWFCEADMSHAILTDAKMPWTDLMKTNLSEAILWKADLSNASLVGTNLNNADLTDSRVYGCSVWDVKVDGTLQQGLIITPKDKQKVTIDNLKVAQFIYLMLDNPEIRGIIDTITTKTVLILGRFTKKRIEVLNAIADKIRNLNLVPIIFDFQKSQDQDIIETIITLAGMSKFVIADVTDARVVADELRSFAPDFAIPVIPLFQPSKNEPEPYASLYTLYKKYEWVFEPITYNNKKDLINNFEKQVIKPAETMRLKLRNIK